MVKKEAVFLIVFLLMVSVSLAIEADITGITVQTEPNLDVRIKITNANNDNPVDDFTKNSGDSGLVKVSASSVGASALNIDVTVKKGSLTVREESSGPYVVRVPVTIDLSEPEEENLTETNITEEPETAEEETEGEGAITGKTLFGEDGVFSKNVLYIAGLILIVGGGVFFVTRTMIRRKMPSQIIVRKQSDMMENVENAGKKVGEELVVVERKLKEVLQDLENIINKRG
ncbi:MAG: hypothetical protein AABX71_02580 [Nanoarchaeota archaeon]